MVLSKIDPTNGRDFTKFIHIKIGFLSVLPKDLFIFLFTFKGFAYFSCPTLLRNILPAKGIKGISRYLLLFNVRCC